MKQFYVVCLVAFLFACHAPVRSELPVEVQGPAPGSWGPPPAGRPQCSTLTAERAGALRAMGREEQAQVREELQARIEANEATRQDAMELITVMLDEIRDAQGLAEVLVTLQTCGETFEIVGEFYLLEPAVQVMNDLNTSLLQFAMFNYATAPNDVMCVLMQMVDMDVQIANAELARQRLITMRASVDPLWLERPASHVSVWMMMNGRVDSGAAYARQAMSLDVDSPAIRNGLMHGHFCRRDLEGAVAVLEEAIVAFPDDEILRANLGQMESAMAVRDAALAEQSACEAGDLEACVRWGRELETGVSVPMQPASALAEFLRACEGGVMLGCTDAGAVLLNGLSTVSGPAEQNVEQDLERSYRLYSDACDVDDALGCSNLATFYERGLTVEVDLERAAELRARACALGHTRVCEPE